jgi:hypothetical protein
MAWLRWLFNWRWHRHDYDMQFEGDGFDTIYRCSCGDVTRSIGVAINRQGKWTFIRRTPE